MRFAAVVQVFACILRARGAVQPRHGAFVDTDDAVAASFAVHRVERETFRVHLRDAAAKVHEAARVQLHGDVFAAFHGKAEERVQHIRAFIDREGRAVLEAFGQYGELAKVGVVPLHGEDALQGAQRIAVVAALFVTASRITIRTQQSENAVNQVIALSEEAGADLSAPYETRDFSLVSGGTVNEELRLVTYEVSNGDGTVRLSKFVYAPAETGGTP